MCDHRAGGPSARCFRTVQPYNSIIFLLFCPRFMHSGRKKIPACCIAGENGGHLSFVPLEFCRQIPVRKDTICTNENAAFRITGAAMLSAGASFRTRPGIPACSVFCSASAFRRSGGDGWDRPAPASDMKRLFRSVNDLLDSRGRKS